MRTTALHGNNRSLLYELCEHMNSLFQRDSDLKLVVCIVTSRIKIINTYSVCVLVLRGVLGKFSLVDGRINVVVEVGKGQGRKVEHKQRKK